MILAALLYKVQGPILQRVNNNTQVWDTSFIGTDIRDKKCHPNRMVKEVPCCACNSPNTVPPVIAAEEFLYCRPVLGGTEIGATECRTTEHKLALPKPREVLGSSCPLPVVHQ